MLEVTIQEFADQFGVTYQMSYGFLKTLQHLKKCDDGGVLEDGKRGKRKALYIIDGDVYNVLFSNLPVNTQPRLVKPIASEKVNTQDIDEIVKLVSERICKLHNIPVTNAPSSPIEDHDYLDGIDPNAEDF